MRRAIAWVLILGGLVGIGAAGLEWYWRLYHGAKGEPQEVTLEQLLTNGPRDNRYVKIRDYWFAGGSSIWMSTSAPAIIESYLSVPEESGAGPEEKQRARQYRRLRVSYPLSEEKRVRSE